MSLRPQHQHQQQQQQRVVADGWGRQASGSVFCADSSLRYIFESQPQPPAPGTTAAAISSLASGEYAAQQQQQQQKNGAFPINKPQAVAMMTSYDKLAQNNHHFMMAKADPSLATGNPTRGADGVDLFEAQIAKSCAQITKQAPALPHSFRECSVCLTQNAYAQISLCGHTFHSKCFLRWFRMNRSCPLCRGPVDKVELAPVLSVQDELEAIMAEMDDDHTHLEEVDPLMGNPELISFLGEGFDDADMEMMVLEDMTTGSLSHDHHHHGDHEEDEEEDDVSMEDDDEEAHIPAPTPAAAVPSMAMGMSIPATQYAPTSTMPNYWNVLNQGLSMPSVAPPPSLPTIAPYQTQTQNQLFATQNQQNHQPRMVPIAPKPDGHFHHHHNHHGHQQHGYNHHHTHPFVTATPASATAMAPAPPAALALAVATAAVASPSAPRVVSCRCTGGCRNGRCACVKEGGMCGVSCRCTSCKNPFLMVKAAGADIDALLQDACFMHNVSKTRDMVQRMQEPVEVPCCGDNTLTVLNCVQGYHCKPCNRTFDFSWCMNKLLDHDKTPRNHCEICKRCCDHRDVHCHDCGRCYFAGVAASLPCPCKESSRKRRDQQNQNQHASSMTTSGKEDGNGNGGDAEDEKEGECSIM